MSFLCNMSVGWDQRGGLGGRFLHHSCVQGEVRTCWSVDCDLGSLATAPWKTSLFLHWLLLLVHWADPCTGSLSNKHLSLVIDPSVWGLTQKDLWLMCSTKLQKWGCTWIMECKCERGKMRTVMKSNEELVKINLSVVVVVNQLIKHVIQMFVLLV